MANIHEVDPSQLNLLINKVKEMLTTSIINAGIITPELLAPIVDSQLSVIIRDKYISINATVRHKEKSKPSPSTKDIHNANIFSKNFIQTVIDNNSKENKDGNNSPDDIQHT